MKRTSDGVAIHQFVFVLGSGFAAFVATVLWLHPAFVPVTATSALQRILAWLIPSITAEGAAIGFIRARERLPWLLRSPDTFCAFVNGAFVATVAFTEFDAQSYVAFPVSIAIAFAIAAVQCRYFACFTDDSMDRNVLAIFVLVVAISVYAVLVHPLVSVLPQPLQPVTNIALAFLYVGVQWHWRSIKARKNANVVTR